MTPLALGPLGLLGLPGLLGLLIVLHALLAWPPWASLDPLGLLSHLAQGVCVVGGGLLLRANARHALTMRWYALNVNCKNSLADQGCQPGGRGRGPFSAMIQTFTTH